MTFVDSTGARGAPVTFADVQIEQRDACPTAVVRRQTTWATFPSEWGPMLDQVYAVVRAGGVEQDGHNVMVFRDLPGGGVDVEVGVQAAGPVRGDGQRDAVRAAGRICGRRRAPRPIQPARRDA